MFNIKSVLWAVVIAEKEQNFVFIAFENESHDVHPC